MMARGYSYKRLEVGGISVKTTLIDKAEVKHYGTCEFLEGCDKLKPKATKAEKCGGVILRYAKQIGAAVAAALGNRFLNRGQPIGTVYLHAHMLCLSI